MNTSAKPLFYTDQQGNSRNLLNYHLAGLFLKESMHLCCIPYQTGVPEEFAVIPLSTYQMIDQVVAEYGINSKSYRSVTIALNNHNSMLSPKSMDLNLPLTFSHCFPLDKNDLVISETLTAQNYLHSYAVNEVYQKKIVEHFPNSITLSADKILIESASEFSYPGEFKLIACLIEKQLHLSLFKGNEIIFCNVFVCENENDIAYYILNCREKLIPEKETMNLILLGQLNKNHHATQILNKYISPVVLPTEDLKELNEYFYILKNQMLCV